jgi:hypothetical protein
VCLYRQTIDAAEQLDHYVWSERRPFHIQLIWLGDCKVICVQVELFQWSMAINVYVISSCSRCNLNSAVMPNRVYEIAIEI